jgi:hypothetical protein
MRIMAISFRLRPLGPQQKKSTLARSQHIVSLNTFTIMSKKTFALVSGIVGGLQTIGVAIVTYTNPEYATAINSSIVVAGAAIIEICTKFVQPE